MADGSWDRVTIEAQSVDAPLSSSAIFLTVSIGPEDEQLVAARDVLGGVDDLVKTVGFRDLGGRLSCVVGIGREAWDRLSPQRRPSELHPFAEIHGPVHAAPATAGDLLFHIRAERADLCFELERLLLDALGDSVTVDDEVTGFRYFDARDLLGFVDGTANPTGSDLPAAALVDPEDDPEFAGGSYVVVQRYLHDLTAWNALPAADQEAVIGRTKLSNVELDDDDAPRKSHKTLATITEGDVEYDILRDNMPFGRPGHGEYGTYFIGYSGKLWVTERMLQRMFIGDPPGSYDRILDFSTAVTGATFFVPTSDTLAALAEPPAPDPAPAAPESPSPAGDGSLGLGSLRSPPTTSD